MAIPFDWAVPGARCVCIVDTWPVFVIKGEFMPVRTPMLNEVLTIREVAPYSPDALNGDPESIYLTFWEIDARQKSGLVSAIFRWQTDGFRPLTQQETDISVFERLLNPSKQTEDA